MAEYRWNTIGNHAVHDPCRVLRELLGSVVAGCQGEAKQRKHLLSRALKRAHNVLGNHQLVSQASRAHPLPHRLGLETWSHALASQQQEQGVLSTSPHTGLHRGSST